MTELRMIQKHGMDAYAGSGSMAEALSENSD